MKGNGLMHHSETDTPYLVVLSDKSQNNLWRVTALMV